MSDEKDSPGHPEEPTATGAEASVPMQMQLFSTWEVRKVPANCVSRLCTLTVTRLEVVRCIEAGLGLVVLAVSMKTPHRFLRSNEIRLPGSGLLDIPLQLTFALQYPHFLKRGGNVLQIRLQRRKRYRNRPLVGYKTLVVGTVDMSQVLQHGFQGEVRLYSEKVPDHVAVVTLGSLTSTAIVESRNHLAEVSSEEDEDDIFSDELAERGSDSESGDNEQPSFVVHSGKSKDRFKLLRLLGLRGRPAKGRAELMSELGLRGEDRESAVTFASSISDSDEEEDDLIGGTPPRPTLRPFFTSEHCSMVSLPTTARSAEAVSSSEETPLSRKYGSLERAIYSGRESPTFMVGEGAVTREWDVKRGRVWCVEECSPGSQAVLVGLDREQEVAVGVDGERRRVETLQSLFAAVQRQWHKSSPFHVVLVGGDELISAAVQAMAVAHTRGLSPGVLTFNIVPTAPGLISARVCTLDEDFVATFPSDSQWIEALQDSVDTLLQYVQMAVYTTQLSLAQAALQMAPTEGGPPVEAHTIPFMCSVSVGVLEGEVEGGGVNTPGSPSTSSGESPELVVEYWIGRKEGQKVSVKVRSVMVSCLGQLLNVTALSRDKKGKIRIRKKESDGGGSIVSLTALHLVCRPVNKQETVTVVVDGVEWEGVSVVRLEASWDPALTFPLATCSAVDDR